MGKEPSNGLRKGNRRQKLANKQDNHGSSKNPPAFENFNGEAIEKKER
ncbi:MAG: clostri-philic family protein [Clostridiaceae bacterium]